MQGIIRSNAVLAGLAMLGLAGFMLTGGRPEIAAQQTGGDIAITLKNDFINRFKNRATIKTAFQVDKVGKIHSAKQDADMHFAGRAEEVGLPIVAEIMNAKDQKDAIKAVRDAEGEAPVEITGAWRIWCEHAGGSAQTQGESLEKFTVANPDHVFEIHPMTRFGDEDTSDSLVPVKGYRYKEAHTAFLHYEAIKCRIEANANTTTIHTSAAGYNYVDFKLSPLEEPAEHLVVKGDGRFVMCRVYDLEGELIARKVRMVFIEGTEPEKAARKWAKNKRQRVIGMPRLDLALVSWRVGKKEDPRKPLGWNLPYEMIIVGVVE